MLSSHLHVKQLSPSLTSISIFLFSPTKFSSLLIFSYLDSFSTIWCECFHAIWLVFLANFLSFAITLGGCHYCFFLALLSLTSNLLECRSEWSVVVMMYHYTLFSFTKTYLAVLYVAFSRQSPIGTLQLTEVIVSGIKHGNFVFNLKFSILLCTTPVKRNADDLG